MTNNSDTRSCAPAAEPGGLGGRCAGDALFQDLKRDSRHVRGTLRLIAQAARNGWPVNPQLARSLPAAIGAVAIDDARSERELLAAIWAVLRMEQDNLRRALPRPRKGQAKQRP